MINLIERLRSYAKFKALRDDLMAQGRSKAEGLWGSSYAYFLAALAQDDIPYLVFVTSQFEEAEAASEDLELFLPGATAFFPAWDTLPGDDTPPDSAIFGKRLQVIRALVFSEGEVRPRIIVAPIQALLQPVISPERVHDSVMRLHVGQTIPPTALAQWLVEREFERTPQVELPNEFSIRGGIFDVYPASANVAYRIEFFGDTIESIRTFDVSTQISKQTIPHIQIIAARRMPSTHTPDETSQCARATLLDYLPPGSLVAFKEPEAAFDRAKRLLESLTPPQTEALNSLEAICARVEKLRRLDLYSLPAQREDNSSDKTNACYTYAFDVCSVTGFQRDLELTVSELASLARQREYTIVFCNNEAERRRLLELLEKTKITSDPRFETRVGKLNYSFDFRDLGIALLAHHDIFQRYVQRRTAKRRPPQTRALDSFLDLQPGDYVVHLQHGIGRFLGMEILERDGKRQEFLALEYEDHAKLYVPVTKIELVQKYLGGTERKPRLNRLHGTLWERRKEMAAKAVHDLAAELLEIQAVRSTERGYAFPADTEWQRKFESEFIYTETEDQLIVAEEIRNDQASPRPMDRLVCGDVGYGKTELAMRAAFRVATAGKQVAVLVPTTVLAAQHYRTFTERMADYPINIEMLSRFKTRAEQQATLERLATGQCDIVIGTHRLLQPDVRFKDLGLVIIDEEQRFGVRHKETLKHMKETVDVLTLTATPIPRTLHMALLGIRDISSLDTPPMDRLAIETKIWRFDLQKIRQAILRELARDGQVFFVNNWVKNIEHVARLLAQAVPEARISIAHGQMPERLLEERMMEFVEHRTDVLVCTNIIESGLDIPNANTIFINRADTFGLADLHQLRGRVGRYKHRAYAYLLLPSTGPVNPTAEKRLKAIEEFSELGSGYKIAMRDLEIRGAGNILGPEQHGHIQAVGYDMYCRLLDMAVRRLKNEPIREQHDVAINIGLQPYLPSEYVPDIRVRMELYRRINRCEKISEVEEMGRELCDRFGPLPQEAQNLLAEARLRILCQAVAVTSLALSGRVVIVESLSPAETRAVLSRNGNEVRMIDSKTMHLLLPRHLKSSEQIAQFLEKALHF